MSWLPQPRDPQHGPFEVRCWSLRNFDHGSFEGYPERQGYEDRTVDAWELTLQCNMSEVRNFFQTWLVWGFLEKVLEKRLFVEAYAKSGRDGNMMLEIQALVQDAVQQRRRGMDVPTDMTDIHVCLGLSNMRGNLNNPSRLDRHISRLFPQEPEPGYRPPVSLLRFLDRGHAKNALDDDILLAFDLLYETICLAGCQNSMERMRYALRFSSFQSLELSFLANRFIADGWCPSEMYIYFRQLAPASLLFLSSMNRPHPERRHACSKRYNLSMGGNVTPDQCSERHCIYGSVAQNRYVRAHTKWCPVHGSITPKGTSSKTCEDIRVVPEHLHSILFKGQVPIVRAWAYDEMPQIQLCAFGDSSVPYVAISHVWGDGLGNLQENAIPECQLKHINHLVRGLKSRKGEEMGYFWLDTLCVPPDSVNQHGLQNQAIALMRKTYADAESS